jgi:DNA-binding XRE family transcriptional regulator
MMAAMPRAEPDQVLAAVLKRLREERDESQEALAHRAHITKGALQQIELGRASPAWSTVRAIAAALEVKMADLAAKVEADS